MSSALEEGEAEELEFKWGRRTGFGKNNKNVQFFDSFSFDGVDYKLYDCVYLHTEAKPEPYIGKLIKIFENESQSRKISVQWFFRPSDMACCLKDTAALQNELFLSTGEGVGLCNLSPLEAIGGKCNVICISTDKRNPQPSDEERQRADYVFYRTFNVESHAISDQMGDMVGRLDVKYVFNLRIKGEERSLIPPKGTLMSQGKNSSISVKEVQVNSSRDEETTCTSIDGKVILDSQNVDVDGEKDKANGQNFPASKVQVEEIVKPTTKSCNIDEAPLKRARFDGNLSAHARNSEGTQKDMKLGGNFIAPKDAPTINVSPRETLNSRSNKKFDGSEQGEKKRAHDISFGGKDSSSKKTSLMEGGPQKKAKLSNKKEALTRFEGDDAGQIFEVSRRPILEKNNWMKLPWEERMKTAYNHGKLVLLQNLDPEYTSREVEDIIWNAFEEQCSAKMVQHTAISNPRSGQAFVILRTSEAADKILKKLNDGCLMLPNKRPLVATTDYCPNFEKQSTFVGHLTLDRAKSQARRETKDAVSTSHYSQNNTIEYEMAMQWRLLQLQSDKWWDALYKQQNKELANLSRDLKPL